MINFGAGPAAFPPEVLAQSSEAILNYNHSGLSILEIPHRGNAFGEILEEANFLVKKLMNISNDYDVMWMQGGGRLQFAMLPMNVLTKGKVAGYVDSGHWAEEAAKAANEYGEVIITASSKDQNYTCLPTLHSISNTLAYLHLTSNNTIYGTQYHSFPHTEVPLVADMSSDIFSRDLDFSVFDMIYAVAQKNLGSTGATMVVAKKEFIETEMTNTPYGILSYKQMAKQNSLVNTAPVFAIYTCLLMLRWIDKKGLKNIEEINNAKAALLYNTIDDSNVFKGVAIKTDRSKMNVCFTAKNDEIEKELLTLARKNNITGIKGHRSVGGFRVSLYNAITLDNVKLLTDIMESLS